MGSFPQANKSFCIVRCRCLIAAFFALIFASSAFGHSFMVAPMRLELSARPGARLELQIRIENTTAAALQVSLKTVDIQQSETGGWVIYDENFESEVRPFYSCADWVSLGTELVNAGAFERKNVEVTVNVPRDAVGAGFAAIIAEPPLSRDMGGLMVRMRYLIPLIVNIEGRAVRQQVEAEDLEMRLMPAQRGRSATTIAAMNVVNSGMSYSRIQGDISVDLQRNERWMPVARAEMPERAIMPKASFPLYHDLQRRLPSGTYRLRGELYVDGRRIAPQTKIIDFQGDPGIDTLALDTALILDPQHLLLQMPPGGSRTSFVSVENPSEYPLKVRVEAVTPDSLRRAEYDGVAGTALSAAELVDARPEEITLPPGSKRNFRVSARLPRDAGQTAYYYAHLNLHAEYPDGQSAGKTSTLLVVQNQDAEAVKEAALVDISLGREEDGNVFVVRSHFANKGDIHIHPSVNVEIFNQNGLRVANADLEGDDSELLPLITRRYSGEVDFGSIEPGRYIAVFKLNDHHQTILQVQRAMTVAEGSETGRDVMIHPEE